MFDEESFWCVSTCLTRWCFKAKALLHTVQRYRFTPECMTRCFVKLPLKSVEYEQIWHWCFFPRLTVKEIISSENKYFKNNSIIDIWKYNLTRKLQNNNFFYINIHFRMTDNTKYWYVHSAFNLASNSF